jgi:hypothetical protein
VTAAGPDRGHGRRRVVVVGHELLPLLGSSRHRGGRRRVHSVGRPQHTVVRRGDRRPRQGGGRCCPDDDRGGAGRDGALADGAGRRRHGARRQQPPGQDPRPPRRVQVRSMTKRTAASRPLYRLSVSLCTRNCRGVNGGIQ